MGRNGVPYPHWMPIAGVRFALGDAHVWKWEYEPSRMNALRWQRVRLRYNEYIWGVRTDGKEVKLNDGGRGPTLARVYRGPLRSPEENTRMTKAEKERRVILSPPQLDPKRYGPDWPRFRSENRASRPPTHPRKARL
jgi:hypothetical protein